MSEGPRRRSGGAGEGERGGFRTSVRKRRTKQIPWGPAIPDSPVLPPPEALRNPRAPSPRAVARGLPSFTDARTARIQPQRSKAIACSPNVGRCREARAAYAWPARSLREEWGRGRGGAFGRRTSVRKQERNQFLGTCDPGFPCPAAAGGTAEPAGTVPPSGSEGAIMVHRCSGRQDSDPQRQSEPAVAARREVRECTRGILVACTVPGWVSSFLQTMHFMTFSVRNHRTIGQRRAHIL